MMTKLTVILGALLLGGCANVPAIIEAASHDPAAVHIDVVTVYGHITYDRNIPR